jgi:type VI secretion system Hcp family effector
VLDYSYRVTQSASLYSGGGGGVGRADFPPLTFSHYIDKASPNLFKYCAAGKHIKEVTLSACKAGGGSKEFLNIELFQVMVVDVSQSERFLRRANGRNRQPCLWQDRNRGQRTERRRRDGHGSRGEMERPGKQ